MLVRKEVQSLLCIVYLNGVLHSYMFFLLNSPLVFLGSC
jgi:hypothetical protein